jgi:hypothetical protein
LRDRLGLPILDGVRSVPIAVLGAEIPGAGRE